MPEEHTYNQPPIAKPEIQNNMAPGQINQAGSATYPQAGARADHRALDQAKKSEVFSDFGNEGSKNVMPGIIVWFTFALVLMLTGYFWMMDFSNARAISAKQIEKDQVVAQLSSTENKDIEDKATSFNSAFTQLNTLVESNTSKGALLTELYTHFTKDVKVSTLSISNKGALSIDGSTGSYRQVADFMLGLKAYDKVSDMMLKSVSVDTEEGISNSEKIKFSITATIKTTKTPATAVESASTSSTGSAAPASETDAAALTNE